MKKKILIMYLGYKPARTYGGPVNSINNIVEGLGNKFDFYIITSNHEFRSMERLSNIEDGWNTLGKAKVLYLSEEELSMKNIINKIYEVEPDVIYLNSIFLYKFLFSSLKYIKNNKIKLIVAPRGELCKNALKLKRAKKEVYIELLKFINIKNKVIWHSTSNEETMQICNKLNICKKNIKQVEVLPTNVINNENKTVKKEKELKCVFISRICEKKNLLSAIKYVKSANSNITLDIYGFIEDIKYWEKCKKEIGDLKRIKYCGKLEPNRVISTFSKYNLFLFPTFSENYGHVIAEAMMGGCPVLISNQTPWNDIKKENAGFVVKLGNDKEFIDTLNMVYDMSSFEYDKLQRNCEKYIERKIDYSRILKKYEDLFLQ